MKPFSDNSHALRNTLQSSPKQKQLSHPNSHPFSGRTISQEEPGENRQACTRAEASFIRNPKDVSRRTPLLMLVREDFAVATATERSLRLGAKRITPQAMERGPGSLLEQPP